VCVHGEARSIQRHRLPRDQLCSLQRLLSLAQQRTRSKGLKGDSLSANLKSERTTKEILSRLPRRIEKDSILQRKHDALVLWMHDL
jgi:hypothetical protein